MRPAALALILALAACDSVGTDATIVAYTGPAITEADAAVANPPFDSTKWAGSKFLGFRTTVVDVSLRLSCGDECAQTTRFAFDSDAQRPADALPESVRGTLETTTLLPESAERVPIEIDRVEIQDWGPRVYSGVVYPASRPDAFDPPIVFWTEITEVAVE